LSSAAVTPRAKGRPLPAWLLVFAWLSGAQGAAAASAPYFYPFVNPYEATVLALPQAFEAPMPAQVPTRVFTLTVFPERKIPDVFWYEKGLICSLAYQERRAPLIFLLAGAGSRFDSFRMVKFQKLLHQAGFHVIALSSPTHMNFVVHASTGPPGDPVEDARDLYRVMELAYEKVRPTIQVSSFALAGYSLGAFHAAFVARLDEEQGRFNFNKVLLVNPPVELYGAASNLDQLLVDNVPGGIAGFDTWLRASLTRLLALRNTMGRTELGGDVIYEVYKRESPNEETLAAVIGLVFRMAAAHMIFAADVMNGGGYIVPRNARLTNSTSLTRFAMVAYRTTFRDYFEEYFLPERQRREPGLTREALLDRMSLRSLEPYLRAAGKFALVHNEDDIILAAGEIDYLRGIFGARAHIFPTGGHMGNAFHPTVVGVMLDELVGPSGTARAGPAVVR
jgi:hypothetical protein